MDTIISNSPEETERAGALCAQSIKPGTVVGLFGELGAGKTCWVRGFARALGVKSGVHSPTFALLNLYEGGSIPLCHIDLYRLEGEDEVIGAGLENYLLSPKGITVVEWIERWEHFLPKPPVQYRKIHIDILNFEQRRIFEE